MIIWQDEALILSSQDFSDTSIILKVFSKNHGVRKGLVRGAKRKNKAYHYKSNRESNPRCSRMGTKKSK